PSVASAHGAAGGPNPSGQPSVVLRGERPSMAAQQRLMAVAMIGVGRDSAAEATLTEIDGRPVGLFRLEGGRHRGAIGPTEAEVIERLVQLALEAGSPIVGVLSSSGADVREGVASLYGWGRIARCLSDASGGVPVVLAVIRPCVSGPALLAGMADH